MKVISIKSLCLIIHFLLILNGPLEFLSIPPETCSNYLFFMGKKEYCQHKIHSNILKLIRFSMALALQEYCTRCIQDVEHDGICFQIPPAPLGNLTFLLDCILCKLECFECTLKCISCKNYSSSNTKRIVLCLV
jgi:hypothetical protein